MTHTGSSTDRAEHAVRPVDGRPGMIEVAAGPVRAVIAPSLGARVIRLSHRGVDLLWRNPELLDERSDPLVSRSDPLVSPSDPLVPRADRTALDDFATWQNWGGDKSWVAPQGWDDEDQWHGPPDRVFDGGEFEVVTRSETSVGMRSDFDPATGLRMTRTVTVTVGGMRVRTTIRNESERVRRWAAWEVAQVPVHESDLGSPDAGVWVHTRAGTEPVPLFALHGTMVARPYDGVTHVPFAPAIGKYGFPGCTGVMEVRHAQGPGLRLEFQAPRGSYPEGGPGQVWMQTPLETPLADLGGFRSSAALVELEATSPLRHLGPGASVSLSCDWTVLASAVPGPGQRPGE